MTEHRKVSQFWISESGMAVTGRNKHGYFAVCSCGAEVYSGPSTPHGVPQPARLEELRSKEQLSDKEQIEEERLFNEWHEQFLSALEASMEADRKNMLNAIERHAEQLKEKP